MVGSQSDRNLLQNYAKKLSALRTNHGDIVRRGNQAQNDLSWGKEMSL